MYIPPAMPRSRSFTRFTMRVGLLHFGQSVLLLVSMTFLRSPVFATLAIKAHLLENLFAHGGPDVRCVSPWLLPEWMGADRECSVDSLPLVYIKQVASQPTAFPLCGLAVFLYDGRGMTTANCDIGLIGLAVMGQNLVLNMNNHGF